MESQKKYGPYNQYIPHKDVVYSLIGYHVYLEGQATYPSFGTHKIEESLHHTLDDAKKRKDNRFCKWSVTIVISSCIY